MGDIIDFKPKRNLQVDVELEGVDEQLLLECAIVEIWEKLGGYEVDNDKFLYHVWFLQFSDLCFQAMEDKVIEVFEDGNTEVEADFMETIQATMRLLMEAEESNDNMPTEH